MSWLVSLIVAGAVFASDGNLPVRVDYNFTESKSRIEKSNNTDETERFEQIYPLNANGRVSVSNVNGSISVETWDRNEVKFEYVKTADTKENLAELEVKIDARQDVFSVETEFGDWKRRNSGERRSYTKLQVEYRLTVPRNAVLDEIETVNGSVSLTGGGSSTKASSVNGQVRAVNLRGTAELSTVNGTVTADFDQLQTGSRISLNTVNGTVNLVVPSDANATVKADTVNGNIVNDFGLPVRKGEYVGRDLYGKIGTGDVQIRLNSVNGTLSVKRKNDGRNANPAINLLTTKNEAAWDDRENAAGSSGVKSPRPPRAPRPPRTPRAPRIVEIDNDELNRTIRESLKEAQKELNNIKPKLDKLDAEALKHAVKIDTQKLNAQIREAQVKAQEMTAGVANVNWTVGAPSVEEKSGSFGVKGTAKVTVDAKNCAVSLRGWDKSEVRYSLVRIGRGNQTKSLDTDSGFTVKTADSEVNIKIAAETASPGAVHFDDRSNMRLEVFVPRKSNLKVITNGEIRLEGVSGTIDLEGAEKSVNIRDAGGKLTVGTTDGRIRVIGFKGEISTRTTGGTTDLEGDFQNLSARTTDGTIVLTLPENANANIESNRKDIVGEGVSLVYQADGKSTSTWKVGNGGQNHLLYATADGHVIVRSAKQLQN